MKYGTRLDLSSDWKLCDDKINTRLRDFVPAEITFNEDCNCASRADLLALKSQLANVLTFVQHGHVLLRHPYIFADSFSQCADALLNQHHQVCKDIFTVPCLVWFFEILLGKFYRIVRYLRGMYTTKRLRALLFETVIEAFLNIGESEATKYSVFTLQAKQATAPKTANKPLKDEKDGRQDRRVPPSEVDLSTTPTAVSPTHTPTTRNTQLQVMVPRNGSIAPKSVCKYWLCAYFQVPFPTSNNVPRCTYQTSDGICPVCPHQNFDDFTKEDFLKLLGACRNEFVGSSAPWPQMYETVTEKIMARQ